MDDRARALRVRCEREGQGHVFAAWERLDERGRARLLEQVAALDFELLREHVRLLREPEVESAVPLDACAPPDTRPFPFEAHEPARARAARARGEELLRAGHVAYLVVAGGQASRLGYEGPKGTYPIGPVSGQSLFGLFAHKLRAARERYGAPASWYVMTSQANDAQTRAFFADHAWFGLDPDDVFFFEQSMLPALDPAGRILMSAPDALFLAPGGHGGTLASLARSGALAHARERGRRVFSYFQVDNPLARPADPLFLGLHALEAAQMSSKVVKKRAPGEKVGVLVEVEGRLRCIEYSDLPPELRDARRTDGELAYSAGNIALHLLQLDFVEQLTRGELELPWHVARKQVTALDASGRPAQVAGIKFETFVFDALRFAQHSVTLEVDRAQEFSPVKNASGEDSPATARADMARLHGAWLASAGLALPEVGADGIRPVEIDPLFATDLDSLRARLPARPQVDARGHWYR